MKMGGAQASGLILFIATIASMGPSYAQSVGSLVVRGPDQETRLLPVARPYGYATVRHDTLERLGWSLEMTPSRLEVTMQDGGAVVTFSFGSPLFWWDGDLLQLVDVPFLLDGAGHVPLQFILDFLPVRMQRSYAYIREDGVLQVLDPVAWSGVQRSTVADSDEEKLVGQTRLLKPARITSPRNSIDEIPVERVEPEGRVVVIDPGHGGKDRGTVGPGGRREKDIALAVGRVLARELRGDEGFEVYMTRNRDVFVPLWERGEKATLWKGERPGLFISIHANSAPRDSSVRGFETYFLSEARTEHERRVAANENAPLLLDDDSDNRINRDPDLTHILRELRNLDHQRWSSLLAEGIQIELEVVHPGPNRGVKQGPFAVITNALMPAVLVEIGFVSNREEERVLSRDEFQSQVARALAKAIRKFYERYPPGQGGPLPGPGQ